jgi:hypothetical protein
MEPFIDTYGGERRGIIGNNDQLGYDLDGPFRSYRFETDTNGNYKLMGIKIMNPSRWKDAWSLDTDDCLLYQNMFGWYWPKLLPKLQSHEKNYPDAPVTLDYLQCTGGGQNHIVFSCKMERLNYKSKGNSKFKMLYRSGANPKPTKRTIDSYFAKDGKQRKLG